MDVHLVASRGVAITPGDESAGTRARSRDVGDVMTFYKKDAFALLHAAALPRHLQKRREENRPGSGMSGIPLDRNVEHNLVLPRLSTFFLLLAVT